jgi:hypothetical protein
MTTPSRVLASSPSPTKFARYRAGILEILVIVCSIFNAMLGVGGMP